MSSICALLLFSILTKKKISGWWISVSTTGSNWNSTPSSFSAQNTVSENIISPENFASKEDFSTKIVSSNSRTVNSLTEEQYEEILRYVKERINLKDEVDYQEISSHILKTETVQNILNEYKVHNDDSKKLVDIEEMIESQRKSISELTDELRQLKMDIANLQNRQEDTIGKNFKIHSENTQKMDYFLYQLNRCCKKATNLEAHMLKTVVAALNNPEFLQNQKGLQNWLNSLFVAKMELENSISQITEKFNSNVRKLLEKNSEFLMDRVTAKLHSEFDSRYGESEVGEAVNISEHTVKRIVKETLKIYDADKTGLVDYAMEPMGGEVITTRCTEGYHAGTAVVSVFGLPLWYPVASPRTVITPGMSPGRCWAFQNFPGILVIKLMAPIHIEAFSYEHISKLLVPDGKIDSSPKNFEVYGLQNENDKNGIKLGSYRYDYYGEPLQFFASENSNSTIQYVELRVISNHGNPNYTCLYRFRVHGRKATS